jgi:hypothetical protein
MQIGRRRPKVNCRPPLDDRRSAIDGRRAATADCRESIGELVIEELEERCVPGGIIRCRVSRRTAGWGC